MGISYSVEHGTYIGTKFLCSLGFDARNLFRNRNFSCEFKRPYPPRGSGSSKALNTVFVIIFLNLKSNSRLSPLK